MAAGLWMDIEDGSGTGTGTGTGAGTGTGTGADTGTGTGGWLEPSASRALRRRYLAHWYVPKHRHAGGLEPAEVRLGFIRKVYGIFAMQMALTTMICLVCLDDEVQRGLFTFVSHDEWTFVILRIVPLFVSFVLLLCFKSNYPMNFVVLFFFTFIVALEVGTACGGAAGGGACIALAFFLTAMIFCGLTAYALVSRRDFNFYGAVLSTALWILFGVVILREFPSLQVASDIEFAISFLGAVAVSLYILFDTWKIMNVFGTDDYIMASIELYSDIIFFFLYVLRILIALCARRK